MSESEDPTLAVARDLRSILELSTLLPDQAAARASHHEMPGGDALVMIGPVSNLEAWEHRRESVERAWLNAERKPTVGGYWDWRDECWVDLDAMADDFPPCDDDETLYPPVQALLFWTEDKHPTPHPTLSTEAEWLSDNLQWIFDNEIHWDDFAKDIANARRRLEATLYAGERDEHGIVRCECGQRLERLTLTDEDDNPVRRDCYCRFRPLPHADHAPKVRWMLVKREKRKPLVVSYTVETCCIQCWRDARHARHDQGGLRDRWVCSGCNRVYDRDDYDELIAKDARANSTALPSSVLLQRFDLTWTNLRVLASRGKVRKHGRDEMGRMLYDVADVKRRAEERVVSAGQAPACSV